MSDHTDHPDHDDLEDGDDSSDLKAGSDRPRVRALALPLQRFLDTEAASGVVLLFATVVAVAWASSPWSASYDQLWSTEVTLGISDLHLPHDLRHWVNDLAMAVFFFVVGLEIKRELVHGDLRNARTAMLPIVCAVGGMVVPALMYFAFNTSGPEARGWGIPMATDIAFSIGVLTLVGKRTPASLKVFLLTLAIVDDIGAIAVIAIFYSSGLSLSWLCLAVGLAFVPVALKQMGVYSLVPYTVVAAALWLAMLESGVHATIAGVILGLLTPARPRGHATAVADAAADRLRDRHLHDDIHDEEDETSLLEVSALAADAVSPVARLERALHPYTSFVILPLFALANAGVDLTPDTGSMSLTSPVALGIVVGLVVGKPLGVLLSAWIAIKVFKASMPAHSGWYELAGVGMLAGIGFTVSLFVTGLAFAPPLDNEAKPAILVASLLAGAIGAGLLSLRSASHPLIDKDGTTQSSASH